MFSSGKYNTRSDSIISISDSESVIDMSDSIISISDDVIVIDSSSESIVNIDDSNISGGHSILTISDTSKDGCVSVITINSDSEISTAPSFDFESSMKMLLPQPRTSTPVLQRSAIAAVMKAKNRKSLLLIFLLYMNSEYVF